SAAHVGFWTHRSNLDPAALLKSLSKISKRVSPSNIVNIRVVIILHRFSYRHALRRGWIDAVPAAPLLKVSYRLNIIIIGKIMAPKIGLILHVLKVGNPFPMGVGPVQDHTKRGRPPVPRNGRAEQYVRVRGNFLKIHVIVLQAFIWVFDSHRPWR